MYTLVTWLWVNFIIKFRMAINKQKLKYTIYIVDYSIVAITFQHRKYVKINNFKKILQSTKIIPFYFFKHIIRGNENCLNEHFISNTFQAFFRSNYINCSSN